MGVKAQEIIVGIYGFEEKYADYRCYSENDIVIAKKKLDSLLAALGF